MQDLPILLRVMENLIREEWVDTEALHKEHKRLTECAEETQKLQRDEKAYKNTSDGNTKRATRFRFIPEPQVGGKPLSLERLTKIQQFPDDNQPFLRSCDICK